MRIMRSILVVLVTAVLLSSTATADNDDDEVNQLYYWYRYREDGGGRYMANITFNFVSGTAVRRAAATVYSFVRPFFLRGDYTGGTTCTGSLHKVFDVAVVCCHKQHMLDLISGGDVHQYITNSPAWVAWNTNRLAGAANKLSSNLIVFVTAMWFGCESGSDGHRVGGRILDAGCHLRCKKGLYMENNGPLQMYMPDGKIVSKVDIALLIAIAWFLILIHCLILTGGGMTQGMKDGKLPREIGDRHNKVRREINPWFLLNIFPTIGDNLGNFSEEGRGTFGLLYRPLLIIIVTALLLPSTVVGAGGCNGYDHDNMTTRVKPLYYDCGCSGPYNNLTNANFYDSRTSLAAKLAQNIRASEGNLFASYTVGSLSGFVLCRGDYTGTVCADNLQQTIADYINVSVADTTQIIICPSSKDLTIYYDQHMVGFSSGDGDIVYKDAAVSNRPAWVASNMNYVSNSSGAAHFYDERIQELLNETARYAAFNSSEGRMYATGKSWFQEAGVSIIYGLVQCRPDIKSELCRQCLDDLIKKVPDKFIDNISGDHRVGGRILGVWCSLRFEEELFFQETPETRQLHKPKKGGLSKVNIALITIGGFVLFALCLNLIGGGIQRVRERKLRRELGEWHNEVTQEIDSRFSLFDFPMIRDATGNFSEENKLGNGSFGFVYRGILPDGLEVAVKRLDASSWQGSSEFLNEIKLIVRLQHANLVRLLGCCLQRSEMILVYEYMSNRSLDYVFSDPRSRDSLKWSTRMRITEGIAQGLVYLHSFLEAKTFIIHRDMKLSNILLDSEMNPKISDFGISRIYNLGVIEPEPTDIVGTRGYMAPEYIRERILSVKYDVFSFGVLLLEIISGRRVNVAVFTEYGRSDHLLTHAWHIWCLEKYKALVDPSLRRVYEIVELKRHIQISLLCVQENPDQRPHMREVITMLSNNSVGLPDPCPPAYFEVQLGDVEASASNNSTVFYTM